MLQKILFFISIFFLVSCEPDPPTDKPLTKKELDQLLIDSQRAYLKQEDQMMDDYALNNQWGNTQISTTGIRYWIYQTGHGASYDTIRANHPNALIKVAIGYQSTLLDGTSCYVSTAEKPKIFAVGESEAISGLHELVTYLRQGDKVKAIIPPRLAYGLAGDLNKIPPNSPVVYDLELLQWNY